MQISPIDLESEQIKRSTLNQPIFVLAMLSPAVQNQISCVQRELRRTDARHIYHVPMNLHITVKPLGWEDVETVRGKHILDIVRQTASGFEAFEIAFEGLDMFPDVVYIKVGAGAAKIRDLNKALSKKLSGLVAEGRYEGDNMLPHTTIATFASKDADDLQGLVMEHKPLDVGRMKIERLAVVKANLQKYYGTGAQQRSAFSRVGILTLARDS